MKSKIRMDSPLPLSRLVFSHPQESRDASHMMVYVGKHCYLRMFLLSSSFTQVLLLSMMLYNTEYPFGHLGSSVLTLSPLRFMHSPRPLDGEEV